jgi:CubicO group peptidase (beta-lactamase class C family)
MKGQKIIQFVFLLYTVPLFGQDKAFLSTWDSLITSHEDRLTRINIVGNGIIFVRDGAIVAESMNGSQDVEMREPITINTIYNWASCTKVFTAIAVMQLRDRNKLELDDPVSKYVPDVKRIRNEFGKDFTIKQILTHTSGLPRFSRTTKLIDGNFYETQIRQEYFERFSEAELQFEPGEQYRYSNFGYDILGLVIEEISGLAYKDYVVNNILRPLGMKKSYFDRLPPGLGKYRSNNYRGHKGKLYSKAEDFDDANNSGLDFPSGGLNAPFTDMMLFINFLCGTDSLTDRPLKYSSLEEMFSAQELQPLKKRLTLVCGNIYFLVRMV